MAPSVCFICGKTELKSSESVFSLRAGNLSPKKSKLIQMKESTYRTCRDIIAVRKAAKLKFGDLILNDGNYQSARYHLNCYRNLTSLKRSHREILNTSNIADDESSEPGPSTSVSKLERRHADNSEPGPSTSKTKLEEEELHAEYEADGPLTCSYSEEELMQTKICIFCRQKQKKMGKITLFCKPVSEEVKTSILTHAQLINDEKINDFIRNDKELAYHKICLLSFLKKKGQQPTEKLIEKPPLLQTTQSGESALEEKIREPTDELIEKPPTLQTSQSGENTLEEKIREIAEIIREDIMRIKPKKLPKNITPKDVIEGECSVPESLHLFIQTVLFGSKEVLNDTENVKTNSICDDVIFVTRKGKVMPAKSIKLGITVKSMTNSRQLITILNRLGHCINYFSCLELETELTYTMIKNNELIPGVQQNNGSVHVAFDNYDRYVDTKDGKTTLHDTVGIIYQFKCLQLPADSDSVTKEISETASDQGQSLPATSSWRRRRRRFDGIVKNISPYYKKPKAVTNLSALESIELDTQSKLNATTRDFAWLMCRVLIPEKTPMWVGFNSKISKDTSGIQTIEYLPQINASPTSYAVVFDTLKQAQEIKKSLDQSSIIVTYDLQIAKMAMQIQSEEAPAFNDVFVNMGGFHVQLSFFKALGKYIQCSGIDNVLVESGIIAAGSLNGVISGKHYSRCRRSHTLLTTALQTLHVELFLQKHKEISLEEHKLFFESLLSHGETVPKIKLNFPEEVTKLLNDYSDFALATRAGEHGKTAQFYMYYVHMMEIYFRFSRSIRTSDVHLLIESLYEMCNIFFAFNHQNYARWTLKFLENLILTTQNNPMLLNEFIKGALGVKRTSISLSRSPVDLALEQSINANAANKLTGISYLTNSISARQRWALSHSVRSRIVASLFEQLGLHKKDDVSTDLKPTQQKRDVVNVQAIIKSIKSLLNPFSEECEADNLFNLYTGRATNHETSSCLLNVYTNGETAKLSFIEECNKDSKRFEKPIKKTKFSGFISESVKLGSKQSDKVVKLKMERDVFGRLLALALQHDIDIELCLKYPLSPVPPALFQYNGDLMHTTKSALAKCLTAEIERGTCINENVCIFDGFFLLRKLGTVPQTYGQISERVLEKICKTSASEVHIVFDAYQTPSIKDAEREKRRETRSSFVIAGDSQTLGCSFQKSLNNIGFKMAFVKFLSKHWENKELAKLILTKKIFLTVDEQCYSYEVQNNIIFKKIEPHLKCLHDEADTRIIFQLSKNNCRRALIHASDTDILVILLANMTRFSQNEIWLSSNEIDCFNITELFHKLGQTLCEALPFLHAFTGCDYNSSFRGKGKIKPFKNLKLDEDLQTLFPQLLNPDCANDEATMKAIQKFTNKLYNSNIDCVDAARYEIFMNKYGSVSQKGNFMKKMNTLDSANMPPCWSSLKPHLLRAIFINSMWLSATEYQCVKFNPQNCGWVLSKENILKPRWFDGEVAPANIEEILLSKNSQESSTSEEEDCTGQDEDSHSDNICDSSTDSELDHEPEGYF